jgi:hypothetical protein
MTDDAQAATSPPPIPRQRYYHQVSVVKFSAFCLLTLNLYTFYWFYQCWKHVLLRDGDGISPFWRTFFAPIFYYPLLIDIRASRGMSSPAPGSFLFAVAFLIFQLAFFLPDPYWMISFFMFMPLIPAVVLIAPLNRGVAKPRMGVLKALLLTATSIFGSIILILGALMTLHIVPDTKVVDGDWLRQSDLQFFRDNQILAEGEEILLFYSAGMSVREDGQYLTDRRLASYMELPDSGELYVGDVGYDQIVGVHTEWSTAWLEDSIVTITTSDDYEFEIWLSPEDEGDRKFVQELRRRAGLGKLNED